MCESIKYPVREILNIAPRPEVAGVEPSEASLASGLSVSRQDHSGSVRGKPKLAKTLVSGKPVIATTRSRLSVSTMRP
jgi:hypothetical protein